jgi:CHAT domain-containing protein/tetratricopeptide (TPR) repeat protein
MRRLLSRARIAGGIGIAVVAGVLSSRPERGDRPDMSGRGAVLAALGSEHLMGVRVSGLKPNDEPARRRPIDKRELLRELELVTTRRPSAQVLDHLGVAELALGRYDAAVRTLERAARRAPRDVGIQGDLSAAYLARGRASGRPRDILQALDRIGQRPSDLESSFNRALALQSLYLNRVAEAEWRAFRERERDRDWRRAATLQLLALAKERTPSARPGTKVAGEVSVGVAAPVDSRTETLESWIEDSALPAWASAVMRSDVPSRLEVEHQLDSAATRLSRSGRDLLPAREVRALSAATGERAIAIAAGLADFAEGKRLVATYEFEQALDRFVSAAANLRETGSPRFWWAEAGVAQCEFQLHRHDMAAKRARNVLRAAAPERFTVLAARCHWILAAVGLAILDLELAGREATSCLESSASAQNPTGVAVANLLLGRVTDELGNSNAAWRYRLDGFRFHAQEGNAERLAIAIGNASFALSREGRASAAVDFASELLAYDRERPTPFALSDSLWTRAVHRARAGDAAGALADVREAAAYVGRIESPVARDRRFATLRAVEGSIQAETSPQAAIVNLDLALQSHRRMGYEYGQAEILIDRARALRRLGRTTEASLDLDSAARLVDSQRGRIGDRGSRVRFFDLQARLADERVATSLSLDPSGGLAFWASDQARGLVFRDALDRDAPVITSRALPAAAVVPEIAPADAVIAYWSLPSELLIWVVRHGQPPRLHRLRVGREELTRQIGELADVMPGEIEPSLIRARARALGSLLVIPIIGELAGIRRLIVVPDRSVRGVPWPVLELGGRPLLERFVIRIRPFAAASRRPIRAVGPTPRYEILVVADAGDRSAEVAYAALPGARREVAAISRLFARPMVLQGEQVTRKKLLTELEYARIVHIAGHFVEAPGGAGAEIVVASAADQSRRTVGGGEIGGRDLAGVRLAVLSGCATDREGTPSLEGTFSAAGDFLAAGAGEVVASMWPIEDDSTVTLMSRFYRELIAGRPADESLRVAQLAMLNDESNGKARRPAHWAAFQLIALDSQARESVSPEMKP